MNSKCFWQPNEFLLLLKPNEMRQAIGNYQILVPSVIFLLGVNLMYPWIGGKKQRRKKLRKKKR